VSAACNPFNLPPGEKLEGERILLRHPQPDEVDWILDSWRDPETMAAVGGIVDRDAEWSQDWYQRMVEPGDGTNCYFLICLQDGQRIGEVSFHRWKPAHRTADLNIKVRADLRGRGYGAEALGLFLRHYFMTIKAARMEDPLLPENLEGRALMTKMGFQFVEETADHYLMVITRQAWLEQQEEASNRAAVSKAPNEAFHADNGMQARKWGMRKSGQSAEPSREEAYAGVDIGDILKENLARQLTNEKPFGHETRRFGRRRRRDYLFLMVGGNLILLLALILFPGLLAKVSAGAGMVLYSVGVTWILYGVMSEY